MASKKKRSQSLLRSLKKAKRTPTAKQLAARAKFVAMVRTKYKKRGRVADAIHPISSRRHVKRRVARAKLHHVYAISRHGERYYLSYDRLTTAARNAQNFATDEAAKHAAKKLARMSGVRRRFTKIVST